MDELSKSESSRLRKEMVEKAIYARGVRSELVLNAMRSVSRESFLPAQLREFAYDDTALPIEEGQTISQPYIVALMIEALALRGGEKVLEIGAGSGYADRGPFRNRRRGLHRRASWSVGREGCRDAGRSWL